MNGSRIDRSPCPRPASCRWRCRTGPDAPGISVRSKSKMAATSPVERPGCGVADEPTDEVAEAFRFPPERFFPEAAFPEPAFAWAAFPEPAFAWAAFREP